MSHFPPGTKCFELQRSATGHLVLPAGRFKDVEAAQQLILYKENVVSQEELPNGDDPNFNALPEQQAGGAKLLGVAFPPRPRIADPLRGALWCQVRVHGMHDAPSRPPASCLQP